VLSAASVSHAQNAPNTRSQTGNGLGLQSLDQGTDDIGPLGQSFLLQPIELRTETLFDNIFRIDDGTGRLVRRAGALNAVFSQSDYVQITPRRGSPYTIPVVPAGTVYYIGDPIEVDLAQNPDITPTGHTTEQLMSVPLRKNMVAPRSQRLLGRSLALGEQFVLLAPDSPSPAELASIEHAPPTPIEAEHRVGRDDVMTNEKYRKSRINELTRRTVLSILDEDRESKCQKIRRELENALD